MRHSTCLVDGTILLYFLYVLEISVLLRLQVVSTLSPLGEHQFTMRTLIVRITGIAEPRLHAGTVDVAGRVTGQQEVSLDLSPGKKPFLAVRTPVAGGTTSSRGGGSSSSRGGGRGSYSDRFKYRYFRVQGEC